MGSSTSSYAMTDKLTSVCTSIAFTYDLPPKAVYDYATVIIAQSRDTTKTLSLKHAKTLRSVSGILSKAYVENQLSNEGIPLAVIIKELFRRLRADDLIK